MRDGSIRFGEKDLVKKPKDLDVTRTGAVNFVIDDEIFEDIFPGFSQLKTTQKPTTISAETHSNNVDSLNVQVFLFKMLGIFIFNLILA